MPARKGMAKQMLVIQDKANFRKLIDELGDDGIAILITNKRVECDDQLYVSSFGEGQQTEFLGLLSYGTIMLHRDYFTDDSDAQEI